MSGTTITISRAERDVILDTLWRWTGEGDVSSIPFETRDKAEASLAALQRAFDLRDELGWTGEDPRETFTATVTPELVKLLRDVAQDAATDLENERASFERAKAGDRDHWFVSTDTLEGQVALYEKQIWRLEQQLNRSSAVLARLDAQRAAVTA